MSERTFRDPTRKRVGDRRRGLATRKEPFLPRTSYCVVVLNVRWVLMAWGSMMCWRGAGGARTAPPVAFSYRPRQASNFAASKTFTSSLTRFFRPSNGHSMTYATAAPASSNGQPQGPVSSPFAMLLRCAVGFPNLSPIRRACNR